MSEPKETPSVYEDGIVFSSNAKKKHAKTTFSKIMVPLVILLVAEVFVLAGSILFNNVFTRLNRNSEDILSKQVRNRANYLMSSLYAWSDLDLLSSNINAKTRELIDSGKIKLENLDSSSESSTPLILEIVGDLVSTMYSKRLSGIYVVFNTQDINEIPRKKVIPNKTGIYIRDLDPTSPPSERNEDLLLSRASISVSQSLNIAADSQWKPQFSFTDTDEPENFAFFTEPLKAAFAAENIHDPEDYGYWGESAHTLYNSDITAVTYSIPLILDDGTIYGVLGIDIIDSYLISQLPTAELYEENVGAYFVVKQRSSFDSMRIVTPFLWTGKGFNDASDVSLQLVRSHDGYTFNYKGDNYFTFPVPLSLYSSNAPFEGDHWAIMGAVPVQYLYNFTNRMTALLLLDLIIMLALGFIGSFVISRRIATPITNLSNEVSVAKSAGGIPHLSETGIIEVDNFASAITSLSRDVVSASTRFLQIIQLASVELGGFEARHDENTIYVTDNFFDMLGIKGVDIKNLTLADFNRIARGMVSDTESNPREADGSFLCKVDGDDGSIRYIRLNVSSLGTKTVGVAEDITSATLERFRTEHDRDYDVLTGLINRRAFYDRTRQLFASPERMGHAALVMLDMDNLKTINDRYGHDYGDKYICQAAECFVRCAPPNTVVSRVSGDEFVILFYGYDSAKKVRDEIANFSIAIKSNIFALPNGENLIASASGGVTWYPEDSTELSQLMKYADFAMYKVKHGKKGAMAEFDLETYNKESYLINARQDFFKLIMEQRVYYCFQPIFNAANGEVFAYEALMRSDLPSLKNPATIISIAKEEKRLQDIEDLTWLNAPVFFQKLVKENKVKKDAYLFINSLAGQTLSKAAEEKCKRDFVDFSEQLVIEITENDDLTSESMTHKRTYKGGGSGLIAIDDYGSGYNGELNLLEIEPNFIKVDISIIRNIDTDANKQRLVMNIVMYAHERNMKIIAEGVETEGELNKVLEIGVDLLQGYFLARPGEVPPQISDNGLRAIKAFHDKRK